MKISVYLHIPFCVQRCSYCDFNTYAGLDNLISPYVKALCSEIESLGENLPENYHTKIHTIYFGGGTPSLLSPRDVEKILTSLERYFGIGEDPEISLEANPGTLTLVKMKDFVSLGVNRLSLGFQSANEPELRLLGRTHSLKESIEAVKNARLAGLNNLNLDLIYGLPNQTLTDWRNSLDMALSLDVEHLSLYSLTIEEETPMDEWVRKGILPPPDPDFAADCYELARDLLEQAGFIHYEISNWARRGDNGTYLCRHNLQYWKNCEYFGLGAGSHGFVDGYRLINLSYPPTYIEKVLTTKSRPFPLSPATELARQISQEEMMRDTVMLGLRLVGDGVGEMDFVQRFGINLSEAFPKEIERLLKKGLVEWIETDQRRLKLTRYGQLLGNQAFLEFV